MDSLHPSGAWLARVACVGLLGALQLGCGAAAPEPEWARGTLEPLEPVPVPEDSLQLPTALAVTADHIYVGDDGRKQLLVVDRHRSEIAYVGGEGSGPLEFRRVTALAVMPDGVLVGDAGNGRLTHFSRDGGRVLGERSSGGTLHGMAVDAAGNVHLARRGGSGIVAEVVDPAGERLRTYGEFEPQPHPIATALHNEAAIAASPAGGVWIVHRFTGRLQRVDAAGRIVHETVVPLPETYDAVAPYVEEVDPERMAFAIVRAPVAEDLTVDEAGRVYVLLHRTRNGRPGSDLAVYDSAGNPLFLSTFPRLASRIAVRGDTLYALPNPYAGTADLTIRRYGVRP